MYYKNQLILTVLKFAKSALEPARARRYAHRYFSAGDALWGRTVARSDSQKLQNRCERANATSQKSQYFIRGVVNFENVEKTQLLHDAKNVTK